MNTGSRKVVSTEEEKTETVEKVFAQDRDAEATAKKMLQDDD